MNLKNWKPKNDLVGVPGKGFIRAKDFSQEDLDNLVARAKNRNKDVHSFLLGADLVPVNAQTELELEGLKQFKKVFLAPKERPKAAPELEAPLPKAAPEWVDKSSQFEPKKEDTKPKRKKRTK